MRPRTIAALLLAGMLVAGCDNSAKPTAKNFTKALNDYFATHQECLFATPLHFPYDVAPGKGQKEGTEQMNALTASGLLKHEQDFETHVDRYSLTPAGERAAPRFCYGHRQVISIDASTPPVKANGIISTSVQYHYTLMDVPVWARTPQTIKAFPKMAKQIDGTSEDTIRLATAGAGWQVPD